jgi:hypothetical protein
MALNPPDEDARCRLAGFESEASEKHVERQTGRHDPGAAVVGGDIWMAGSLEVFTPQESAGSPAVASTTRRSDAPDWLRPLDPVLVAQIGIAWRRGRDEGTPVAAVAAVAPWQARLRCFLQRGARLDDREYRALAVCASIGLIGFVVVRVVLSPPASPRRGLLDSVGTVGIGGIVSAPAPLPIEPRALVDVASVVGSEPEPIVPPAATVSAPPRTVLVTERPRAEAVKPLAVMRFPESPSPATASTTAAVPPSEPLVRLPAAVDPRPAQPQPPPPPEPRPSVAAAPPISAETSGPAADRADIQALLNRYQNAFNSLNAGAAKTLWPSVDERTLGRAFDQLKRQEVVFDACQTAVTGLRAVTSCQGHASYVPKVGNKIERIEAGRWTFKVMKSDGGWKIEGVESRAVSP